MAYHPGNHEYSYTEQPFTVRFPKFNKKGKDQTINFKTIPNQKFDNGPIQLNASSDSGMEVRFCVIEGPAVLEEYQLRLTQAPKKAIFPIKVTVAAYQWGRHIKPLVKSAETVYRSFLIEK